ncbi:hypothetical protein J2W24_002491 [Variovorax boronicumulans]|uniref:hypothetical protein n=1 Tax=Variovorax boronicumulans TaxID=436515 RepID=UPI0027884FD7|nr:hypothetical protein [Variovorax boronicumulans]MDP9916842.1 hypothetical protein [Variovorax boronicumulans]
MNRVILAFLGGVACAAAVVAIAEPVRVPVDSDDKGTAYIAPNVNSTEISARTNGATVGVQRPDGSALEAGTDTSGKRPTYSVGAKTGGDVSFSGGAHSDGKANTGVKAGVTIKY